jgi:calmodulin
VFDRDRNGFISADELRHQVTTVGDKLTQDEVTDLLRVADQNGDGLIDYKEVSKGYHLSANYLQVFQ